MVDINKVDKINQLNAQYDNKTVKIQDNQGKTHDVKLSVFQEGMAVTSDTKDAVGMFNFHKDGKLDAEEAAVLKKVIADYAGSDSKLDDKEILQIFGMSAESPDAEKILKQFKNMVERQATGSLTVNTTGKNGEKRTESINADGSGTIVEESEKSKTTSQYAKGNVLVKKEVSDEKMNTVVEYTNNEDGKPIAVKTVKTDKSGTVIFTSNVKYTYENGKKISMEQESVDQKGEKTVKQEQYTYNEQGQLIKTVGKNIKPNQKTKLPDGKEAVVSEDYTIECEYHPNGKIAKKIKTTGKPDLVGSVSTSEYNEQGQIVRQETKKKQLRVFKDKDGNTSIKSEQATSSVDYKYHSNGQKSETVVKSVDTAGHPSEVISKYAEDGKTLVSMEKSYYKCGAKVEEKYDGVNINNRKGLPSEKIEYEQDGTTIKQKTINHFDADGILVGRDVFDKDGNKLKTYDFSQVDGKFEVSNQGSRGDCYLLTAINSLAISEDGQKLLQKNVEVKTNDKGQKEYTIKLPGASKVLESLKKKGVPEDKISVQDSFTVTEDELKEAAKKAGIKYCAGDKDVLLLEVAYEKYRNSVAETLKANGDNKDIKGIFGMRLDMNSDYAKRGDYLSGGLAFEALYVLTGNAPAAYINPKAKTKSFPVCYVDDNLQLHLTDPDGNIVENVDDDNSGPANAKIESLLKQLEKDCEKDGKIDNFAATVGFKISQQEVNGQVISGGGHAFSITKVDKDYVYMSNPWSPDTEIKMSRADFAKAATKMSITAINDEGKKGVKEASDKPLDGILNGNDNGGKVKHESNYTVPKGKTYTGMIKEALISQGIPATPANIQKAKKQFEEENPTAVHKTRRRRRGRRRSSRVVSYLYANDKVYIPQFKIN